MILNQLLGSVASSFIIPDLYTGKTVMFALMGQSNMVGRDGPIESPADDTDTDILMYNAAGDSFITAADPLDHFDETSDTVGPGLSFAKQFKTNTGASKVLLVGCAEGSTGFIDGEWNPIAGTTFENAETRWEAAYTEADLVYGSDLVIGGICWIQGEDEIQNHSSLFSNGKAYLTMPMTTLEVMRNHFSGMNGNTPVVFGSVPPGSTLTAITPAYTQITAETALVGGLMNKAGFAQGSDLTTSDGVHYDNAASRTLGTRMATAHAAIASADPRSTPPAFVPDASNVSTEFRIDVSNAADGEQFQMEGTNTYFSNKRVWVENGALQFDGDSELRWGNGTRGTRIELSNKDFSFKTRIRFDQLSTDNGIFSLYNAASGDRSFSLQTRNSDIRFLGSSTGASVTVMLLYGVSTATWYDLELRRVGTALSLILDSVTVDTYTLSGGYTFYSPASTYRTHLGDYQNSGNLDGEMESVSLEFLS